MRTSPLMLTCAAAVAAALFFALLAPAQAQYKLITTCGTVPGSVATLTAGNQSGPFMDVNGNVCTNAGSGGGAITAAINSYAVGSLQDGADSTQGTKADAAYAGSGSTTVIGALKGIYAALVAALPAGSNVIGKVGIDQTTPGTTNAVSATNLPTVAVNVAPVTATNPAVVVGLRPDSPGIIPLGPAAIANSLPIIPSSQYPGNATSAAAPITASATGTTGATTATLAGVASKTTFICGFTITSDATAALAGTATVTGTVTGTLNYIQNVGGATAAGILTQSFAPCIPASAANTGIAVNSVAAGTGGSTAVTAWGYQL